MRRKDREVTNIHKMRDIISHCYCCRLGLNDDGKIYIVPLNFGYSEENDQMVFYFHSAKEGRKIDILKKNPYVGFELDTHFQLQKGKSACQYSSFYQSVIGEGRIEFIENSEDKKRAFEYIMKHYTDQDNWDYSHEMIESVCMFQLIVETISCKEH